MIRLNEQQVRNLKIGDKVAYKEKNGDTTE